jgi:hypothetical protein
MRQQQITTNTNPNQTPILNFLNVTTLKKTILQTVSEPTMTVHCDICSDKASATRTVLDARGWGLYDTFEFCPTHEEMI